MAGPPTDKIPPPPTKPAKGRAAVIQRWLNHHPTMKKWWPLIAKWAPSGGIDPLMFAALIYAESGGHADTPDSSAGAVGIAQILLSDHPDVSRAEAKDPDFAIRWAIKFFGQKVVNAGYDYSKAYRGKGGYNPGGPDIFAANLPKGYTPIKGTFTDAETAARSAAASVAAAAAKERLTGAEFKSNWAHLNDIFYLYTGKNATRAQAQYLLTHGYSDNTLARQLTKTKAFYKSPMWKTHAPDFMDTAKAIYGDQPPPGLNLKGAVAQAIRNNWSLTAFAEKLRDKPQYFKSNEFKQGVLSLESSYRAIYGAPDANAKLAIQEATLGRWNKDQWEAYLRSKPEYYNSDEFRTKQGNLASMLGFIPQQTQNPQQQGQTTQVPDSPRLYGDPNNPTQQQPPPPTQAPPPPTKPSHKPKPKPKAKELEDAARKALKKRMNRGY